MARLGLQQKLVALRFFLTASSRFVVYQHLHAKQRHQYRAKVLSCALRQSLDLEQRYLLLPPS